MTPIGGISLFQGEVFFISLMKEVYIQKKEVGIQMGPGVHVSQLIFVCLHNSRLFRFYSQTGRRSDGSGWNSICRSCTPESNSKDFFCRKSENFNFLLPEPISQI